MIKLYWAPRTRAIRAMWMLEEAGVAYERVQINLTDESSRANPDFRRASPLGKVPAIEDGPVRLNDSGAICLYIADAYPQMQLAPAIGHPDRGAYLQWVLFTNTSIEPAMIEKMAKIAPNQRAHGWGSFDSMMSTLRAGLERGPWILGERFSAADVLIGSALFFLTVFKLIDPEPLLDGYVARCFARPAAQRAKAAEG